MKRCPTCSRVENDDALAFCRVDGTPLLDDSSQPAESITRVLEHAKQIEAQPAEILNDTAESQRTTSILTNQPAQIRPNPLPKIAGRKLAIIISAIVLVIAIVIIAGFLVYRHARDTEVAISSIAVLPFENQSRNPDSEYLSDGVTESIINSLTHLPNLAVSARSSVFRYKGKGTDPMTAGKELGVRAVLTGRILQRGDDLVISTELLDVRDNKQLWGEQYSEKVSDLLSVQRRIANEITSNLRLKLSGEQQTRLVRPETENPEAYLLYLKGRYHTARYTKEGLDKGREYFNQAIATDPKYALAYVGIADNYIAASDWFLSSNDALPKAGVAARKALELDDQVAEAHTSLATVEWWFDWNWPAAEREFKRAIQLNPNDARTLEFYGWYLIVVGRIDEGIEQNRRAQTLDPLSVETNTLLGQSLYFAGRYDQAIAQLRTTLDMDQNYWLAHSFMGRALEQEGKFEAAIAEFQRAGQIEGAVPENHAMLAHAYALSGKKSEAQRILEQMKSSTSHVPRYNIAIIYAGLGDKDQAFAWLDRAYADRSFYMTWLKCDPQLNNLRSDPRFADLVRRVGLPQ